MVPGGSDAEPSGRTLRWPNSALAWPGEGATHRPHAVREARAESVQTSGRRRVLVSLVVADLCAGKDFTFTLVGEAELKSFDEPVALYEVRAG